MFTLSLSLAAAAFATGMQEPSADAACVGVGKVCNVCSGENICSQGGKVVTNPHVYLIYWGWTTSNDPKTVVSVASDLIGNVNGTPYMNVLSQYGVNNSQTASMLSGTFIESSAMPADTVAGTAGWDAAIAAVAKKTANSSGHAADRDAVWVVATPHRNNHPAGYCARHDSTPNGSNPATIYVDLPYQPDFTCFSGAGPASQQAAVLWHELAEAFTDPRSNTEGKAFVDKDDEEIADKCQGEVPHTATFRSSSYRLNQLWSNATNWGNGGCVTTYRTQHMILERASNNGAYSKAGSSWIAWGLGQNVSTNLAGLRWNTSTNGTPAIRSDVWAVGANGNMVHGYKSSAAGTEASTTDDWGPPPSGYTFTGRPTVISPRPARLNMYVRGMTSGGSVSLFSRVWDATAVIQVGPTWNPITLPSGAGAPCSAPTAVSWTAGDTARIDLFYLGCQLDPHLHHLYWIGSTMGADDWGTSTATGHGSLIGAPAVASFRDGRLDVFVTDNQGQIQHAYWDNGSGGWDNWGKPSGTTFYTDPSVTEMGDNRLAVAAAGRDGNFYEATWGFTTDAGWVSYGHASSVATGALNFAY
jgi:hypothetical protein